MSPNNIILSKSIETTILQVQVNNLYGHRRSDKINGMLQVWQNLNSVNRMPEAAPLASITGQHWQNQTAPVKHRSCCKQLNVVNKYMHTPVWLIPL